MVTKMKSIILKVTIVLLLFSCLTRAEEVVSDYGKIFIEQENVQFTAAKYREPSDYDTFYLQLINYYRAEPIRALIDFFPELLSQADAGCGIDETPMADRVATELSIGSPNRTQYDERLAELELLMEEAGVSLEWFEYYNESEELKELKENIVIDWADSITEEQIKSLDEITQLEIFNEDADNPHNFDPKPPFSMDGRLNQCTLNHMQWQTHFDVMTHREPESLMEGAGEGVPYFGDHSMYRAENVGYPQSGGNENMLFAGSFFLSEYGIEPWTEDCIRDTYKMLFVDTGVSGRGHRHNLMNEFSNEIGVTIAEIDNIRNYKRISTLANFMEYNQPSGYTVALTKENWMGEEYIVHYEYNVGFISGVVYNDTNNNDFFSYGEGDDSYELWAVNKESGDIYDNVTTFQSGAYKIEIDKPGEYTVYCRKAGYLPKSITVLTEISDNSDCRVVKGVDATFKNPGENLIAVTAPSLTDGSSIDQLDFSRSDDLVLSVDATGYGNTYSWYFIDAVTRSELLVGTGATLILGNIDINAAGEYICRITNEAGSTSKSFYVEVRDSVFLDIQVGWNLLSITRDISQDQFNTVKGKYPLWQWRDSSYTVFNEQNDDIPECTFWAYSETEDTVEIFGQRTDDDLPEASGWTLGSVNETKLVGLDAIVYSWDTTNGRYVLLDQDEQGQYLLVEGVGYWIFRY